MAYLMIWEKNMFTVLALQGIINLRKNSTQSSMWVALY